jgi:Hg(II)-responsive transcriptional regulator
MRSTELATAAQVSVQTLRYYERRGLLPEPDRLASGYRDYGPDAVNTVCFIKRAQQLGFSLEEVAQLLDLANGGPENCDATRALATEKLTELEAKIASLSVMRDALLQLVATCNKPRSTRQCPILTGIRDDASEQGPRENAGAQPGVTPAGEPLGDGAGGL